MKLESHSDTLRISGMKEIGAANADEFRDQARAALKEGHKDIEIDLTETTFIDSSGLGAILALHKTARTRKGTVRLLHPQPPVQQILDLTRMDRVLEIVIP